MRKRQVQRLCLTCRHYRELKPPSSLLLQGGRQCLVLGSGSCRINPPTWRRGGESGWPQVDHNDWCSAWDPAENKGGRA